MNVLFNIYQVPSSKGFWDKSTIARALEYLPVKWGKSEVLVDNSGDVGMEYMREKSKSNPILPAGVQKSSQDSDIWARSWDKAGVCQ